MRDERNPILSNMNGMNGPLIVGACGGGIPVAMVPVVPVGAMNGSDQGTQNSLSNMGNGSGDMKYDDKKRINQGQNKNINRKLPSNGAQRMPLRPVFNSKPQPPQIRNPSAPMPSAHHAFRPQNCLPYLSRYPAPLPAPPPYATYPPTILGDTIGLSDDSWEDSTINSAKNRTENAISSSDSDVDCTITTNVTQEIGSTATGVKFLY